MTTYSRRSALRFGGLSAFVATGLAVQPATSAIATFKTSPRQPRINKVYNHFTVGADNNEGFGNNTLSAFQKADQLLGPLSMRRSFPSLESFGAVVAADKAAGYRSFVSAQVPGRDYAGLAAGKYDARITSAVRGLPAGTCVTMNHEPENDVPGQVFVKMFRRFYQVAKTANSEIRIGPAHLTYGWRNGKVGASGNNTGTQTPHDWDVGDLHRDFTAADTYAVTGQALETDLQFRAWFDFFNSVSSKPLGIAEYGQYAVPPGGRRDGALERKRAALIARDAAWLDAQPQFTAMWLVWNGSGAQGNWKLQDQGSIDAWKAVAALRAPWR
jgi:hypothetical protein